MTDRPIIFAAPEIRALLAGKKRMTRRLAWRVAPCECGSAPPEGAPSPWQSVRPGDRLLVKHDFALFPVYYKPIPGWENLYAAGTDGQIYRMDGAAPNLLRGAPTSRGYLSVSLRRGDWKTYAVHKLVCTAFYGPPPFDGAQVRHLDGDRINNVPGNLDWGTQENNWKDRKAHGRGMGSDHHAAKLTRSKVSEIVATPLSQRDLARKFGVSQSTIWEAKSGGTWRTDHEPAPRNMLAWKPWSSPIHMPRWASRLTLVVTATRIERLQDISEDDARAEGVDRPVLPHWPGTPYRSAFRGLWNDFHGAGAWEANPEVVALTFDVIARNIDALASGAVIGDDGGNRGAEG